MRKPGWLALWLAVSPCAAAEAAPVIVAAERAYADIAAQIAGPDASVVAVMDNPSIDPHEFEPAPSTARAVAGASLTIANGLGYDSWMERLQGSAAGAVHLVVGDLLHRQPGDNPHLWYDPAAMPALAAALCAALPAADPAHKAGYAARCEGVLASLASLRARVRAMRAKVAGVEVAATEPVFGWMEQALGLTDRYGRLELSQMNATEPRAGDLARLLGDLRDRRVRVLFANAQAEGPASLQLEAAARAAGVAVVRVGESLPANSRYQAWVGAALDATASALGAAP